MQFNYYPPSPLIKDSKVLYPTQKYKNEVFKVAGAILMFFIIYLILVMFAVGLAALVSFLGMQLVILRPMLITIMLGLGLVGLGLMVIFFLIKFIFSIKKIDRSGFTEIKIKEYPELFSFIKQLSAETKTPMPKRIYLSPEVNASVFYDSSFFSMLFPVKKNLLIGLGFVNSVNMSEFKAVIAHEFGHFSQHSMKLGSYVFNVNKIIYNMLYENEGYANTLDSWASASGYFAFFANLTVKIVSAIQWVLQKVYIVVNKSNLSLSRQMEHHADSVSAFVCGPNHLVSALKRLEIGDICYNNLINSYNKWIAENIKPINIYDCHREVISHYASELEVQLVNGLPRVDISNNKTQSRLIIKDQWASHPSTSDREIYLKSLHIPDTISVEESPWKLFISDNSIQQKITEDLFSTVKYEGDINFMDLSLFRTKYFSELDQYSFDKKYKGYYDNRRILPVDIDSIDIETNYRGFEDLFTSENCTLPQNLAIVKSEIQILKAIEAKQYDIKSFDFDGKKYKRSDISRILMQVEAEEKEIEDKINILDSEIIKLVLNKSNALTLDLFKEKYKRYFEIAKQTEHSVNKYNELGSVISPIYEAKLALVEAQKIIDQVKVIEKEIIGDIQNVIAESKIQNYLDEKQHNKLDRYLSKDLEYFTGKGFVNSNLDLFNESMNLFLSIMYEREFRIKKEILDMQIQILQ